MIGRQGPSGPFFKPQIVGIVSGLVVPIAFQQIWAKVAPSINSWIQSISSPEAPFNVDVNTGIITYIGDTALVKVDYSFSVNSLAGNDIIVDCSVDFNDTLIGTGDNDFFSSQVSLLGLTANGFSFTASGSKQAILQKNSIINAVFLNFNNADQFTLDRMQIVCGIVG